MRTRKNLENLGKTRFFQSFLCSHTILTRFSHNSHTILTRFSHDSHTILTHVSQICSFRYCVDLYGNRVGTRKNLENLGKTRFFQSFRCSHTILTQFSHNTCPCSHTILTRFSHNCVGHGLVLTQFSHTALTCFSHTWSKESGAEVCEGGCEKHVSANCNCNCSFSSHPHHHNHHDSDGFQFGCKNGELALTCAPKVFFMSQCNVISGWCT